MSFKPLIRQHIRKSLMCSLAIGALIIIMINSLCNDVPHFYVLNKFFFVLNLKQPFD